MGQSASTQREEFLNRDSWRLSQLLQDRNSRSRTTSRVWSSDHQVTDQPIPGPPVVSSPPQDSHSPQPIATFSRQISTQSIPVIRGGAGNNRDISTRDDVFYEQHEERPPAHMEDMGVQDGQITHITASPMPRRSSRLSNRFSSLVMPRYATNETTGDSEQDHGEGRSWRRRLSNSEPSSTTPDNYHSSRRLSIFGSFSPRFSTAPRSRRPRERAPISRPFPLTPDGSLPPSGFTASGLREILPTRTTPTDTPTSPSRFRSLRDSSRLSRVRRSISSPFEALLPASHRAQDQIDENILPPPRPSRRTPTHDNDFQLPPLDVTDPSVDVSPELDPVPPVTGEPRFSVIPTVSESPERLVSRADGPRLVERWSDRSSVGRREGRRMPNMLRGRSSRLIRRENEGPLPRILHLAATAIAAQLSGTPEQPIPDMQAIGPDDLDGSLQNLFRTLQNATNLTGDTRTHDENDPTRPAGTTPPLNFLRVFRFVSQGSNNTATQTERAGGRTRAQDQPAVNEDSPEDPDGRTVTLVVVGVRSVPSNRVGHEDTIAAEPSLDSLLNLPTLAPSTNALRSGAGSLLRHASGRSRFPHRRRASIPGLPTFPANYDSQRHQRTLSTSSRQGSVDTTPVTGSATPLVISESPPGPHPPPSTPADPGLSAYSSAATTPSRRPSSASAIQPPPMPSRDVATQHLREAGILAPDDRGDQGTRVQQRRRSDSEFARHRDLGAGAARRNGVVEPDEVDSGDTPASGSRSWLIYVVGTNLSEDHPALTTPSLFTDVSSFSFDLLKVSERQH